MAYKNIVLKPNNTSNQQSTQKSQFYKGFSTIDNNAFSSKLYDFNLIKQDILNILNTKKGERVMNPSFGTKIWSLIFEPLTNDVKQLITDDINAIFNYDPRVTPTQIKLTEVEQGFIIDAVLYYKTYDVSSSMSFTFDKNIGLVTSS